MAGAEREALDEAFGERMLLALVEAGLAEGRPVTRREVARRAAEYLGLEEPIPERTVGRYFKGRVPEVLRVIVALARAMHVDPGWLAFGPDSRAPTPRSASLNGYDKLDPPA